MASQSGVTGPSVGGDVSVRAEKDASGISGDVLAISVSEMINCAVCVQSSCALSEASPVIDSLTKCLLVLGRIPLWRNALGYGSKYAAECIVRGTMNV